MVGDLLAGVGAGLAVALPIGAVGSYLVGLAARERLATAAAAALGVATVDGAYAVVAAVGGAGLQPVLRVIATPLQIVAALVLVAVAVWTLRQGVLRHRQGANRAETPPLSTPGRAYLMLIAMTAVNPATIITFAAVVLGRGAGAGPPSWSAVALFAVGACAASACWQLMLAGGGTLLGRVLRGRGGQLLITGCSSALMLGLAVAVLTR